MTTVSSVDFLSPYSQIEQLGSAIGDFATSLFERTEDNFRRVVISKRDAAGNIKAYPVKDTRTGGTKRVSEICFIENVRTGDLQLDEPVDVIMAKCATYAMALPFYAVGKMVWYAVKTPIEIGALAVQTLATLGQQLLRGECSMQLLKERMVQMGEALGNGAFEIVKTPFFAIAAEIAAIYGIFKPFPGRAVLAKIENGWQLGIPYKNDFRDRLCFDQPNCWESYIGDIQGDRAFYLARCFQVRDNIRNPRIVVIRRESL